MDAILPYLARADALAPGGLRKGAVDAPAPAGPGPMASRCNLLTRGQAPGTAALLLTLPIASDPESTELLLMLAVAEADDHDVTVPHVRRAVLEAGQVRLTATRDQRQVRPRRGTHNR